MTYENKIIVGLDDIKALTFECNEERCGARVTLPLANIRIPRQCPQCGHEWLSDSPIVREAHTLPSVRFCDALVELTTRLRDGIPQRFKILLEFEAQP
jgi:hypothetical protein